MKILVLAWRDLKHPYKGGAEVYMHEICKQLVKKGHEITYFTSAKPGGLLPEETIDGIKFIRRGNIITVYLWAFWYYLTKLSNEKFDLIIDQHNGIPFFTPLYIRQIPIFCLVHHVHINQWPEEISWPLSWIGYYLENYFLPIVYRKRRFVAVSPGTAEQIINHWNIPSSHINLAYNGIDSSHKKSSPKSQHPSLIYVGRLKKYKGIDLLIRSLLRLLHQYPTLKLNIVGDGDDKIRLVDLAERLGIKNNVIFHGYVSPTKKIELLSSSWAMILPSHFEGWGISIIEANACGTIAIGSDIPGIRDSIVDNETGFLFETDNIFDLANKIKSVISSPALRCKLEKKALQRAKKFTWQNSTRQLLKAINTPPEIDNLQIIGFMNGIRSYTPKQTSISGGDIRALSIWKQLIKKSYNSTLTISTTKAGSELIKYFIPNHVQVIPIQSQEGSNIFAGFSRIIGSVLALPKISSTLTATTVSYSSCEHLYDTLPAFLLKIFFSKPWMAVIHWVPDSPFSKSRGQTSFLNKLFYSIQNFFSLFIIKYFANQIFAVSEDTKAKLIQIGFNPKKIQAVSCGLDLNMIKKIPTPRPKKYDAIYLKRLDPGKGALDLIPIWQKVIAKLPHAKLLIVGSGPLSIQNEIQHQITVNKLQNNITLIPPVYNQVAKYKLLKSSKIFILPSYEENWSISTGEALICGLPVISYKLPEIIPLWKKSVIWVEKGNTTAFAKATINTLISKNLRHPNIPTWLKNTDWSVLSATEYRTITNLLLINNLSDYHLSANLYSQTNH